MLMLSIVQMLMPRLRRRVNWMCRMYWYRLHQWYQNRYHCRNVRKYFRKRRRNYVNSREPSCQFLMYKSLAPHLFKTMHRIVGVASFEWFYSVHANQMINDHVLIIHDYDIIMCRKELKLNVWQNKDKIMSWHRDMA